MVNFDINKLKVGDEVVDNHDRIGAIKRITPTGRIVVDYGRYETRYGNDGWELGKESVWYKTFIKPLTPEKKQELIDKDTIRRCINKFDKSHNKLTADVSAKILDLLEGLGDEQ